MSATQLPKGGVGKGGRHKVEGESGIPSLLWNYNYPYKYVSVEVNGVQCQIGGCSSRTCLPQVLVPIPLPPSYFILYIELTLQPSQECTP